VDQAGDILIAGVNGSAGFAAKLSGATGKTIWIAAVAATPRALAADSSGSPYITGTAGSGFQATPGAFQTAPGDGNDAFILKLSGDAGKLVYATFLGGSAEDDGYAIAVDAAGQAYVAGQTLSTNFPVTPGAAQNTLKGIAAAFVSRLDSAGAHLVYSTYLGGTKGALARAIALDSNSNAHVTGLTDSTDFPVTSGVFQTKNTDAATAAFVTRFSAGGALLWSTFLGGSDLDEGEAIAVDGRGNIFIAGNSHSVDFPLTPDAVKGCRSFGPWIVELDSAGARLLASSSIGGGGLDFVYGMWLDSTGAVYLTGVATSQVFFTTPGVAQTTFTGYSSGFASKLDLGASTRLYLACLLNAASFQPGNFAAFPSGEVAPGEIVSIFGTVLDGAQVSFDGIAAPIFYSGPTQINAVVPYGIKNSRTQAAVQRAGITYGPIALPVAPAVPGIFTATGSGQGQAAVLNQDGTLNSVSHPAPRGSIITFYAAGAGLMIPQETDGAIQPLMLPLPVPQLPVSVQIRGVDARVTYAGAAPGLISGALQVNVEVPTTIDFGNSVPLSLNVGGQSSQLNVTIAVK